VTGCMKMVLNILVTSIKRGILPLASPSRDSKDGTQY
jgi:hypothetical protein